MHDHLETITRQSRINAALNISQLAENLKQQVSQHEYIDKIASYSPNYRMKKKSQSPERRTRLSTQKNELSLSESPDQGS